MMRRLAALLLIAHQAFARLRVGRRDAGLTTVEWLVLAVGLVVAATAAVLFYQNVIQQRMNQL